MMTETEDDKRRQAQSKSGIIPRPNFEPFIIRESKRPKVSDEQVNQDEGSTTGVIPIVTEGEDRSAERDSDAVAGS